MADTKPEPSRDPFASAALQSLCGDPRPLPLRACVQHYAWGGVEFIPRLLGIDNPQDQPYAELWIGAHPNLPSRALIDGAEIALDALIEACPETMLGTAVARRYHGRLPFLLKILSAGEPLSIQAHPNKRQAREGFARENAAGIPLSDELRDYKDENHKPELIAALTDFYALRGFKPLNQVDATLKSLPELAEFARQFKPTRASLVALYTSLMHLPQEKVNSILAPLLKRLRARHARRPYDKQDAAYWVLEADQVFSAPGRTDRGLFSIFLLNLVHLKPGDAMYLPDGELHAYLEGSGVEIMANSNNVLRGGLTPKHVAVDELLRVLTFRAAEPEILVAHPVDGERMIYHTPADEFELSRLQMPAGRVHHSAPRHAIELGIVLQGRATLTTDAGRELELSRSEAFVVPYGVGYGVASESPLAMFCASLPARG